MRQCEGQEPGAGMSGVSLASWPCHKKELEHEDEHEHKP